MRRTTAWIAFLLIAGSATSPAWSQARLGFRGAGLELDVVGPENVDTALGFGAFADLGTVTRNVRLESYMGYWSKSEEAFGARTTASDLSFGARSKYMFRVANPRLLPFAGAGLGVHFIEVSATVPEQSLGVISGFEFNDSATKIGLDFGGGLLYNLNGRASLMSEVWYSLVDQANQLSLEVGVLWHFALR